MGAVHFIVGSARHRKGPRVMVRASAMVDRNLHTSRA